MSKWLDDMFSATQVERGGVIRRAKADVEKYASMEELKAYVEAEGFHAVLIGDQVVVLCNDGKLTVIV